jgi:hypothetical protein
VVAVGIALLIATTALQSLGWQSHAYGAHRTVINGEDVSGGLSVVGSTVLQPRPEGDSAAEALSKAQQLAYDHPTDFGYPWLDGNTITLSYVTSSGRALAENRDPSDPTISYAVQQVSNSIAKLTGVADAITRIDTSKVPGAEAIYRTEPDHLNNRVIVTVSRLSPDLTVELLNRFGADVVAVRVDASSSGANAASRPSDSSPFYGGSRINVPAGSCSDAFSWSIGDPVDAMLTAAHCVPAGGTVSTPAQSMGTVQQNTEENWNANIGTVFYAGQGTYRGDVALVRLYGSRDSAPYIYRDGPNSGNHSPVRDMFYNYAQVGEKYCTGGATTGEICGFTVEATGVNEYYVNLNGWVRNVVLATKGIISGSGCVNFGDSGGSVFSYHADDSVKARGVISGFFNWLGEECDLYFTDIYVTWYGLPGTAKTLP